MGLGRWFGEAFARVRPRATNTRKRPQTERNHKEETSNFVALPSPACKCVHCGSRLTAHTQRIHMSAHRTKVLPAVSEKSTTNTRKGPQACFCTRPPADACAVAPSLQCIHSAYTCLHIVRSFYPHSLKEVVKTQGRDLKLFFCLRPPANACAAIPYLQCIHICAHRKRLLPALAGKKYYKHKEETSNLLFLPAPACKREHCGSFLTLHTRACTSYDSSQREQAIAVLQQARFCHKCSFPL